jgi:hypothetical protein
MLALSAQWTPLAPPMDLALVVQVLPATLAMEVRLLPEHLQ